MEIDGVGALVEIVHRAECDTVFHFNGPLDVHIIVDVALLGVLDPGFAIAFAALAKHAVVTRAHVCIDTIAVVRVCFHVLALLTMLMFGAAVAHRAGCHACAARVCRPAYFLPQLLARYGKVG